QFPGISLIAEGWVGEVDVSVLPHHDVVRGVQTLAFPFFRQHFDLALLVHADNAPSFAFATVEAALRVERVAVGAVGIFAEHFRALAGSHLSDLIVRNVAEQEEPFAGPDRAFGEAKARVHLVDADVRKILAEPGYAEQQQERKELHFRTSLPTFNSFSTDFTPAIFLASRVARSFCFCSSTAPRSVTTPFLTST